MFLRSRMGVNISLLQGQVTAALTALFLKESLKDMITMTLQGKKDFLIFCNPEPQSCHKEKARKILTGEYSTVYLTSM